MFEALNQAEVAAYQRSFQLVVAAGWHLYLDHYNLHTLIMLLLCGHVLHVGSRPVPALTRATNKAKRLSLKGTILRCQRWGGRARDGFQEDRVHTATLLHTSVLPKVEGGGA